MSKCFSRREALKAGALTGAVVALGGVGAASIAAESGGNPSYSARRGSRASVKSVGLGLPCRTTMTKAASGSMKPVR